jgi:hypothetical protein
VDTENCTGQLADFIQSLLPEKEISKKSADEPQQEGAETEPEVPAIPRGLKED